MNKNIKIKQKEARTNNLNTATEIAELNFEELEGVIGGEPAVEEVNGRLYPVSVLKECGLCGAAMLKIEGRICYNCRRKIKEDEEDASRWKFYHPFKTVHNIC
jgi:hypothetical protein